MNKALFLDRDGVIIEDHGYVHKPKDVNFINYIFDLCNEAKKRGYLIIIVTNQAGIAKEKFTIDDYNKFHIFLLNEFRKRGVFITKTYFCPHHIDGTNIKYKKKCKSRKPGIGMFMAAKNEFNIDMQNSIMIGDMEKDIIASSNAGIAKKYLISNSYNKKKLSMYDFEQISHLNQVLLD